MDEMTCPQCQSPMNERRVGDVTVQQCTSCDGVFLARADLGALSEAESEWFRRRESGPVTQPMPKITADMTAPPPSRPAARSFLETLFG
jgi:Zn-finger nucleic acid-binding protein